MADLETTSLHAEGLPGFPPARTTVVIFLNGGGTFTFKGAVIETDNEGELVFNYLSMHDGGTKRARFLKRCFAGFATEVPQ